MSAPSGIHPDLFDILNNAVRAPHEYKFKSKSEATTLRHRLYTVRRKLAAAQHPMSPAFDTLSISVPKERPSATDGTSEWYWTIGEGVIYSNLRAQIEAHSAAAAPLLAAGEPTLESGAATSLAPSQPEQSSHETDAAMAGFIPTPRPLAERESTSVILDDLAKANGAREQGH